MTSERDEDFAAVLRHGYGTDDGAEVALVFTDCAPGDDFDSAVRVGMLARLLSDGVDWEAAAAATSFAMEVRPADATSGGLWVEFGETGRVPLDVFEFASDPIAAVVRMVQDSGGALGWQ